MLPYPIAVLPNANLYSGSNPQQPLRVGSDASNSTPFNGVISEVAIYDAPLSSALITQAGNHFTDKYPSL